MEKKPDTNPVVSKTWKSMLGAFTLIVTVHLSSCHAALQLLWPG